MRLDQMEFGMRVKSQFRAPLDRQLCEAVVISRERKTGTYIMYSKVKYDRCKVHKIETKPTKSQYRKTVIDALNKNLFKEDPKELNSAKRSRPKSNKNKKTEKYMRKVGKLSKSRNSK